MNRRRKFGEWGKREWSERELQSASRESEKVHPIQLPSHEHPLVEYLGFFTDESSTKCHICSKLLVSSSLKDYVFHCPKCNYYFHWSCLVPFLQQINHPSHPHHLLTICAFSWIAYPLCFQCGVCGKSYFLSDMPHFECARCNFKIDRICALSIPTVILENKNNDPLLCHRQPMRLVEINKHDEEDDQPLVKDCYICELPLSNSCHPAYSCTICHHFFHRSCTQLSSKIRHPFHPRHVLIVKPGRADIKCHSCHKASLNFVFQCSSSFACVSMCVKCTFSRPTIRSTIIYQGHNQPLSLMEKEFQHEEIRCNSPYSYCKRSVVSNELIHTERYVFCCQSCNFSLHLLCGPLPCVIKHSCHIHPLTLLDSMIEDDSGEYYCDACETQRDPRICVYYCAECKYIAHVNCVISEVVRVLQGDCRDVELRAVGQMNQKLKIESYLLKDLFTLLVIVRDIGDENEKMLEEDSDEEDIDEEDSVESVGESWFEMYPLLDESEQNCLVRRGTHRTRGRQERHQIGETSIRELISDKNFEELVQKLNNFDYRTRWSKVTKEEMKTKIVYVEDGYMIPWNLAHVLKAVLDKFGDISGDHVQNKSPATELTNIFYFYVCRLLYNMSRVMMVDITEDDLGDWYSCLEFLKLKGFKVDFIYSGLQQIVRAYFGLEARRAEIAVKAKRDQQISNLRQEIEELEAKLKRSKEELESYERLRRTSKFETTIFMKQCLDEASKLEWKFAADCLDLMY